MTSDHRGHHVVTWYLILLVLLEVAEDAWVRGLVLLALIWLAGRSGVRLVKGWMKQFREKQQDTN